MQIDPTHIKPHEFYQHLVHVITPRPIAWVSSISAAGITNLAPFSFFNGVGANPPSVVFSPVNNRAGVPKDTLTNVQATGQFVVNIVSRALCELMNQTAYEFEYGVSEFEQVGLTAVKGERVSPPRVGEASVSIECTVMQIVPVGEGPLAANLVIGRIELMHVRDDLLAANGMVDASKLDTVGRLGGAAYCTTRDVFDLPRPVAPMK